MDKKDKLLLDNGITTASGALTALGRRVVLDTLFNDNTLSVKESVVKSLEEVEAHEKKSE